MPVSPGFARATGAFFRNVQGNLKWVAIEGSKQAMSIWVINPFGKQVKATAKAVLHIQDVDQYGRVITKELDSHAYSCADGYEYAKINGQVYVHDVKNNRWNPAS